MGSTVGLAPKAHHFLLMVVFLALVPFVFFLFIFQCPEVDCAYVNAHACTCL